MPRGKKSKLRARAKRHQAHIENQDLGAAQATESEREMPSSSSQNGSAAGIPNTPEVPQGAPSTTNTTEAATLQNPEKGIQSQDDSSDASQGNQVWCKDPLTKKVVLLVEFLMQKYQNKELITKADMLKFVIKKEYKYRFNEIFKRASDHMELAFGIDLKEVDPIRHCYALISKLDHTLDATMSKAENMPKTGLLMIALSVIFMNGNCAPEEEIWKVLNIMGVYADRKHFIYGEPRKVITEDLVQLKYLKLKLVPNSNPSRYEFMWGPRAYAETSKMKVLEFLAKIHSTTPSAFPACYEEALRDEEERARARVAARARNTAMASSHSRMVSSNFSHAK